MLLPHFFSVPLHISLQITDQKSILIVANTGNNTYNVLCPSTALFLLSCISLSFGIFTFNSLHTEDIDLVDGYSCFIIAGLMSLDWFLDWQNVLQSL